MPTAAAAAATVPAASGIKDATAASNSLTGSQASSGSTPHSAVLGTNLALGKIHQVRMHVAQKCKMGISFWPMFSFNAPDREPQSGTAQLVSAADIPEDMLPAVLATEAKPAAAAAPAAKNSTGISSSSRGGSSSSDNKSSTDNDDFSAAPGAGSSQRSSTCEQLLLVNFTRDPPDEVSIGAKFLGGIPFPFLSIRTTRLEGIVDPCCGAVRLMFEAAMLAQVGSRDPIALPLLTTLTTEPATAFGVTLEGKRLQDGNVTLVSAAEVPKTSSWLANWILWLPTAATALLPMHMEFTE